MKLTLLGATGATGLEIIRQAHARGIEVTAVVRTATRLGSAAPQVDVVAGDVFDVATLAGALSGRTAALCVIGAPAGFLGRGATTVYSRAARALTAAMAQTDVRRLLFCTSAGVEARDPAEPLFYRFVAKPLFLQRAYDDMKLAEAVVRESALAWTLVRPGRLVDGPPSKPTRASPRFRPVGGRRITRAGLAQFMLDQVDSSAWLHQTPTLLE